MHQSERLHALDAVRAFALLLGVFFHAAISFVVPFTNGSLNWAIADNSPSYVLLSLVGMAHIFRMSLFFFIAGFFAHLAYHRKGAAAFARDRATRIVLPFIVGWCALVPLLAVIWHWGQAKSGIAPIGGLFPSAADWSRGEVTLTHLWFLYYLILMYVLVVGIRHVLVERMDSDGRIRLRVDAALRKLVDRHWAPIVMSLPMAIAAIFSLEWRGGGMPTPDHSLIPELIPLAGYGATFVTGWLFHRDLALLSFLTDRIKSSLWLALLSGVLSGATSAVLAMQPDFAPALFRALSALFATMLTWYFNFALIGFALKKFAHPSVRTRYVADASYWLYIAHLPVVCALQVWVANWSLHWTIKYSFIMVVSFAILFASYHYLVRFTSIGAVLNGRKYPKSSRPITGEIDVRSPAIE